MDSFSSRAKIQLAKSLWIIILNEYQKSTYGLRSIIIVSNFGDKLETKSLFQMTQYRILAYAAL
jgi:hypothetical protein